jgi:hypothetical protein
MGDDFIRIFCPCVPVQAFAFPLFTTITRPLPDLILFMQIFTGAAFNGVCSEGAGDGCIDL